MSFQPYVGVDRRHEERWRLGNVLRERTRRWLDKRIPRARSVTLDQRRVFIFPSATGFFFMLCLLIMLIASINYQNNMGYGLTFLLANIFVIAVVHSYANLAGLTLTAVAAEDAFAQQHAAFRIRATADSGRGHYSIKIGWAIAKEEKGRRRLGVGLFSSPSMRECQELDLDPGETEEREFHLQVGERGWYRPGRVHVESVYPLGLLRCWTWVDLDLCALVYPQPKAAPVQQTAGSAGEDGLQVAGHGDDEFAGVRDYRPGDSPKRVYWRGVAKGQEMQSKEFAAVMSDTRWLDWDSFAGLNDEARLSALCHEVLSYHKRELSFGLRLPGKEISPASGDRQRRLVLRTLATYGKTSEEQASEADAVSDGLVRQPV
ncbi:MAG: DUF58 domain-containing protein [Pseudomonadota bacterium]